MLRLSVISPNATYQLARSISAVDEGNQVIITLNTTGVQNGQAIPYTITGTGITSADFVGSPPLTGTIVIGTGGVGSFVLTARADVMLEGLETFTVTLNDSSAYITVNINDTSAVQPGETWTYRGTVAGATGLNSGVWVGDKYVFGDANGKIFTSLSGITWTDSGYAGQAGNCAVISMHYDGTTIMAGMANGTVSLSLNGGASWTNYPGPSATSFGAIPVTTIAKSNTLYVVGGAGGKTAVSTDGITWDNGTSLTSVWTEGYLNRDIKFIVWSGTGFVATGASGHIAISPDGVTWTRKNGADYISMSDSIAASMASGGGYVIIGCTSGLILVSANNGNTWVFYGNLLGGNASIKGCGWTGTRIVVIGDLTARASAIGSISWPTPATHHGAGGFVKAAVAINSAGVLVLGDTKIITSP